MARKDRRPKDDPAPPGSVGRPRWKPTAAQREHIKTMAGRGTPQRAIAAIVGCDVEALTRECAEELELGRAIAVQNVCGVLYANACKADHQFFKDRQFYLMNVAGFSSEKVSPGGSLEDLIRASMRPGGSAPGSAGDGGG